MPDPIGQSNPLPTNAPKALQESRDARQLQSQGSLLSSLGAVVDFFVGIYEGIKGFFERRGEKASLKEAIIKTLTEKGLKNPDPLNLIMKTLSLPELYQLSYASINESQSVIEREDKEDELASLIKNLTKPKEDLSKPKIAPQPPVVTAPKLQAVIPKKIDRDQLTSDIRNKLSRYNFSIKMDLKLNSELEKLSDEELTQLAEDSHSWHQDTIYLIVKSILAHRDDKQPIFLINHREHLKLINEIYKLQTENVGISHFPEQALNEFESALLTLDREPEKALEDLKRIKSAVIFTQKKQQLRALPLSDRLQESGGIKLSEKERRSIETFFSKLRGDDDELATVFKNKINDLLDNLLEMQNPALDQRARLQVVHRMYQDYLDCMGFWEFNSVGRTLKTALEKILNVQREDFFSSIAGDYELSFLVKSLDSLGSKPLNIYELHYYLNIHDITRYNVLRPFLIAARDLQANEVLPNDRQRILKNLKVPNVEISWLKKKLIDIRNYTLEMIK